VKQPDGPVEQFVLDGEEVVGITSSLREGRPDDWRPLPLAANRDKCFQGPIPVGTGFIIAAIEAKSLLDDDDADYSSVVRPYVVGDDVANRVDQSPSRWIIDFGSRGLEGATKFPRALQIVRERVKPEREQNAARGAREKWWQFGAPRVGMREAIRDLPRYAVVGRVGKRMLMAWQDRATCPSDLVNVFAFDDDYSMGILLSKAHDAWAWAQSSTLETRLRYTPTTVFETFPWPGPVTPEQREVVASASAALYARRSELCREHNMGLTALYNLMDEGGFTDLAGLHKKLDVAVAAAYGWPASVAQDSAELVRRLTALNREIVEGGRAYSPFGASAGA